MNRTGFFREELIRINAATLNVVDVSGAEILRSRDLPRLIFNDKLLLSVQFLDVAADGVTPHALPDGLTFVLCGDCDYTSDEPLMFKSDLADPSSAPSSGLLKFMIDTNTGKFASAVAARPGSGARFEIVILAYPAGETVPTVLAKFNFNAENRIDDNSAATLPDPAKFYSATQIDSLFAAGFLLSFSGDGANWHDTQADGDLYWRFRNGALSENWSEKIKIPAGLPGRDGANGTNGADGANGEPGLNGTNGASILHGSGAPSPTAGSDSDHYLDIATGDWYVREAGIWSYLCNFAGGAPGDGMSHGDKFFWL